MSTPGIVAVRRNLTPGSVFFRQIGSLVQYSLDNEIWYDGFYLPDANEPDEAIPPARIDWSFTLNFFTQIAPRTSVDDVIDMFDDDDTIPDRVCRAVAMFVYHVSVLPEIKVPPFEEFRQPFINRIQADPLFTQRFMSDLLIAARAEVIERARPFINAFETSWLAREIGWQIGQTEEIYQEFVDFVAGVEPVSREILDQVICLITQAMSQPGAGLAEWISIDWSQLEDANAAAVFAGIWTYDFYPMFLAILADKRFLRNLEEHCPCNDCRVFIADEYDNLQIGIQRGRFVVLQKDTTSNTREARWLIDYDWSDSAFEIPANQQFRLSCVITLQERSVVVTNSNSIFPRVTISPSYRLPAGTIVTGDMAVLNLLDVRGRDTLQRDLVIRVTDQFSGSRDLIAARVGLRTAYLASSPAPSLDELNLYSITTANLIRVKFCIEYL